MSVHVLLAMLYFQTLPCIVHQRGGSHTIHTRCHSETHSCTIIRASAVGIRDIKRLLSNGEDTFVRNKGVVLAGNRTP